MNIDSVKKYFWTSLTLLLVVLIIAGMFSISAIRRYIDASPIVRSITVSAEGKTVVTPDIAKVSFSVISEGMDTVKIAEDNVKKMNKTIDFVKEQGVDVKDIQTAGYNLSPKYAYNESTGRSYISGYTLTQTVYITIRDFSKISAILGTLPTLGVNNISSLSFDIEDQDTALADARNQAFEKAFAKAKEMADKNGVKIKRVVTFSDYQNAYYPVYNNSIKAMATDSVAGAATPNIEAGSQEVKVNVSVTYELH